MEVFLNWLRANPDVFGFGVATLIFFITIILVSRKLINFAVTILLLIFSLIAGFAIANQNNFTDFLKSKPQVEQSKNTETAIQFEVPLRAHSDFVR